MLPALAVTKTKVRQFGEERDDQGNIMGSGNTQLIFSWKQFQVALENECYALAHLEPGVHLIWSEWGGEWEFLQGLFGFQAGQTYYVDTTYQANVYGPMVWLSASRLAQTLLEGIQGRRGPGTGSPGRDAAGSDRGRGCRCYLPTAGSARRSRLRFGRLAFGGYRHRQRGEGLLRRASEYPGTARRARSTNLGLLRQPST